MHYKDGTLAIAGDMIVHRETHSDTQGAELLGVLTSAQSQSTTCNGNIQPYARRVLSDLGWGPWQRVDAHSNDWTVTLSKCYKVGEGAPPPTGGPGDPH